MQLSRLIGGVVGILLGLFLIVISFWVTFIFSIYGVIVFVIGIVILLNKNEDKIEQVNYKEVKHRK